MVVVVGPSKLTAWEASGLTAPSVMASRVCIQNEDGSSKAGVVHAMAGAALTYDGAGVCVAACDALRLAAAPGGGGGGGASTGAC